MNRVILKSRWLGWAIAIMVISAMYLWWQINLVVIEQEYAVFL